MKFIQFLLDNGWNAVTHRIYLAVEAQCKPRWIPLVRLLWNENILSHFHLLPVDYISITRKLHGLCKKVRYKNNRQKALNVTLSKWKTMFQRKRAAPYWNRTNHSWTNYSWKGLTQIHMVPPAKRKLLMRYSIL